MYSLTKDFTDKRHAEDMVGQRSRTMGSCSISLGITDGLGWISSSPHISWYLGLGCLLTGARIALSIDLCRSREASWGRKRSWGLDFFPVGDSSYQNVYNDGSPIVPRDSMVVVLLCCEIFMMNWRILWGQMAREGQRDGARHKEDEGKVGPVSWTRYEELAYWKLRHRANAETPLYLFTLLP